MWFQTFFDRFYEFFSRVTSVFEHKRITFLTFPLSEIPVFEAAILAYKQKVMIFEMPPIQVLIYKVKASFLPNSKSLPRLAQFLHVPRYSLYTPSSPVSK